MATSTDTRTRFVKAAAKLLHEKGYEGMSLGEVISRSGAPRGSLYYHFPGGKDELVCEAARLGVEYVSEFLRECFGPAANPVRAVRRYALDAARELEESGFILGCPVAPIVFDGVASAELRMICREALATWQQIIAERLRMAGLSAARARSFAGLAVSAVEGALLVARARRDIALLEEVGSELAAQLAATLSDKEDAHE